MQISGTMAEASVAFQASLSETTIEQDSQLLSLPLEILEQIGRACPDGPTAVAYTRSCKSLYALRPKILTTEIKKLSWTLQQLLSSTNRIFLKSFLEYCESSPHRHASFFLLAFDEDSKKQVEAVFPKADVLYPQPVLHEDARIFAHWRQEQEVIQRIVDLERNIIRREPPMDYNDFMGINNQHLVIHPLPEPPVLNLIQMLQIQHEMQRLEGLQQQRDAIADAANQIRNLINRFI